MGPPRGSFSWLIPAPGKFLITAAEHDTPKRARAYLVTDEAVADTAARYADLRPPLDEVSQQAIEGNRHTERPRVSPGTVTRTPAAPTPPGVILWATLLIAPAEGGHRPRTHGRDRHDPPVDLPAPKGALGPA